MRYPSLILVSLFLFSLSDRSLAQQTFVRSPNVGGSTGGDFPFNVGDSIFQTLRYQQVYASSDFLARMPAGGYINGLRFDIADSQYGGHAFGSTLPSIQINLSTTFRPIDGLSSTFAQNLGSDDTVVLGPAAITLSDLQPGGADIIINFATAFFYHPSAGNLLLDVRNFGGGRTSPFNANNVGDDTISMVFSGSVNDDTGFLATGGLVTIFNVTPVPEPSVAVLGFTALGVFGLWRCGRKWRQRKS